MTKGLKEDLKDMLGVAGVLVIGFGALVLAAFCLTLVIMLGGHYAEIVYQKIVT